MTKMPPDGAVSERVQDAIDALMFMETIDDLPAVREACVDVFADRKQHVWPPTFSPPATWADRFERMAAELELDVRDLETATAVLQRFIDDIDKAEIL